MRMVYLGLFSKIFEWVFSKILKPIVDFIASLLGTLFGWVFNNILVPILTLVLQKVFPWFLDILKEIFGVILYGFLSWIFKFIDYLNIAFDIFIGTSEVKYQGGSGSLLNAMMSQRAVSGAFWIITSLGLGIAMLLCIYAVMKSTLDFDFENKRPVGAVMRSMLKCFFQFLLIPFFVIVILQISNIVLEAISVAFTDRSAGGPGSLGCILFGITSLDAAKEGCAINLSNADSGQDLLASGIRQKFYTGKMNYMDIITVMKYFDLGRFDYLVGITMGLFLAVIMVVSCITFIRRIFEVLTLYHVSPLFVSVMPLDDGEKFKKWREMFIAKIFGGYGSLVAMKLYLILCPVIIGNSIQWGSGKTSMEATYFIKLIFLVGGAWAMLKVGPMITSLLNAQTGQTEQALISSVGGSAVGMIGNTAGKVAGAAGSAIKKAQRQLQAEESPSMQQSDTSTKESGQKYSSQRYQGNRQLQSSEQYGNGRLRNENHTEKNKSTDGIF